MKALIRTAVLRQNSAIAEFYECHMLQRLFVSR